jgi:hypothetical protein
MKHTKGPWKTCGASGRMITTLDPNYGTIADVDTKANAKLIAASPQLLETCEFVLDYLEHGTCTKEDAILWLKQSIELTK